MKAGESEFRRLMRQAERNLGYLSPEKEPVDPEELEALFELDEAEGEKDDDGQKAKEE